MTRTRSLVASVVLTGFLVAPHALVVKAVPSSGQSGSSEERARLTYQKALEFLETARYDSAIEDFQRIVNSFPETTFADDALLRIAEHYFDRANNPEKAQEAVQTLLAKYATEDSAPMGQVLAGRIKMARARKIVDIDKAISDFERAETYVGTDAVPAALYYAADADSRGRRFPAALDRYRRVLTEYPRSAWTARALLGEAFCLTALGQSVRAMASLQRIRTRFRDAPEASRALGANTILHRIYIGMANQKPGYQYSERFLAESGGKIRDVFAIAIDPADRVFAGAENAGATFDTAGKPIGRLSIGPNGRGVFLDRAGRPWVAAKGAIRPAEGSGAVLIAVPRQGKPAREFDEIPAAVYSSTDEMLIVDTDGSGSIERFTPAGKYLERFTESRADRLAINGLDVVAALSREDKTVRVFDREGKLVGDIKPTGQGYKLQNPVDVAYDWLGHLYVLDRDDGSVLIFGPTLKLVGRFTLPLKAPGSFRGRARALGVDSAGRLYIYVDDAQRIQIYE